MRFLREYLMVFLFALLAVGLPSWFLRDDYSWLVCASLRWAFLIGVTCGVRE